MFHLITFSAFYPADEFLSIWKLMLLNQSDDILPGSCIKRDFIFDTVSNWFKVRIYFSYHREF